MVGYYVFRYVFIPIAAIELTIDDKGPAVGPPKSFSDETHVQHPRAAGSL